MIIVEKCEYGMSILEICKIVKYKIIQISNLIKDGYYECILIAHFS